MDSFLKENIHSELLEDIVSIHNLGIWECDIQTGGVIISERCAEMLGLNSEERISANTESMKKLLQPDDMKAYRNALYASSAEQNSFVSEMKVRHKNGEWIWVQVRGKVVAWTQQSGPCKIRGTVTELVRQKWLENQLLDHNWEEIVEKASEKSCFAEQGQSPVPGDAENPADIQKPELNKRDREKFYKTILETAQDGVIMLHGERITDANVAYCRMSGYKKEELIGKRIRDLNSFMTAEKSEQHFSRIVKDGTELFQSYLLRKDGRKVDVEISATCLSRDPLIIVTFLRDITERRIMEKELEHSHDLMRYIIEHSRGAVAVHDRDLKYLYVSQSYFDIYNVKEKNIIGKHHYEVFPDLPQRWRDAHQKALNGEVLSSEEDSFLREDGSVDWTRWECRPWFTNNGEIGGIILYAEVINERKEMEQAIYNERELFKTTLLSVGDGIISTDKQGKITVMNQIAESLTGWTQEDAKGRSIYDIFRIKNEQLSETTENILQKALKNGENVQTSYETILVARDGKETPIESSVSSIKNKDGEITGVVIVLRDYTDKKEKQNQIEHLSFYDHLTGLYNRRYMEEAIKRLDIWDNLPFTIIVTDVNGLKLTNDAFGHEAGDRLLKEVAEIMRKACRADDIICRTGGDEFAILLTKTDFLQADAIKKRIAEITSETKMESMVVSMAIGFSTKQTPNQSITDTLREADNNMYKNKLKHGKRMRSRIIETVLRNINSKYDQEQIHTERVSQYCESIAVAMKLSNKEVEEIKIAGILHDIGKITVPPELLNKTGSLTKNEIETVRRHSEAGYQILKSVDEYTQFAEAVLYHHERWDGAGYPTGLKQYEIPLFARIIAVADSFEAMTSVRPYQKIRTRQEAKAELERCAGTQFDPDVVRIFIKHVF